MKLYTALLVALVSPMALATAQPPQVRVTFADGRVVEGAIDEATDDHHLWIRLSAERVELAASYGWDEVATIDAGDQQLSKDQLLADRQTYMAGWPEYFLFDETQSGESPAACVGPTMIEPRAASTSFVATLANWDGDVEPDGYEIAVTVLDEYGHPMPVRGTLSATLVGERTDRRAAPHPPVVLQRWSERMVPEQFAGGPAVFRLPFRQIRPERDLELAPGGILQIEVGAFGHGRFASSAAVAVREFNPVRDRFEQRTGSRFFPGERHERWHHE
jgi:hypothetical protein